MIIEKKIALIGNPNSGKSTLFNLLTGLNQKTANFPGVTVEKKTGVFQIPAQNGDSLQIEVTDLPGTYSIYPQSPDEEIPLSVLFDKNNSQHPACTILVADASNLKRSLFLCTQIIDLKIPVILALNMMDLVKAKGISINTEKLQEELGIPVVSMNALKNQGVDKLKELLLSDVLLKKQGFIDIQEVAGPLLQKASVELGLEDPYIAFQTLVNLGFAKLSGVEQSRIQLFMERNPIKTDSLQAKETLRRYELISQLLTLCVRKPLEESRKNFTNKLDKLLIHKIWGYVFFFGILFMIFQAIFSWSAYPMAFFQEIFGRVGEMINESMPEGVLRDLIVNGIMAGLGGIVIFIPQIALLFMFITLMEDTGYMSRGSFLMDKLMRRFGLNGKSVIPLMSGAACAVPAIMSARTIQNKKERLITILVTPLISCSARIPVYTLIISLVIPSKSIYGINLQGLVLMLLYLLGFIAALGSAWLMNFLIKAKEKSYFVMEMPIYRIPQMRNVIFAMVDKVKIFLFDAGKIIISISIILWMLSTYGPEKKFTEITQRFQTESMHVNKKESQELKKRMRAEKLEASYAGIIGKSIEPLIRPMGFDWKIGIALVTSFAAREVFVGTMSTIYSIGQEDTGISGIRDKMLNEKNPKTGQPLFTLAMGISLMLFYAFAMQCMSTVAVVYRETGGWKWPLIQILYMSGLAYAISTLTFQLLK